MDNSSVFSEKRYKIICQIQEFLSEGCSYREIAKRMGVGRNTIAKYREGDPKELSIHIAKNLHFFNQKRRFLAYFQSFNN